MRRAVLVLSMLLAGPAAAVEFPVPQKRPATFDRFAPATAETPDIPARPDGTGDTTRSAVAAPARRILPTIPGVRVPVRRPGPAPDRERPDPRLLTDTVAKVPPALAREIPGEPDDGQAPLPAVAAEPDKTTPGAGMEGATPEEYGMRDRVVTPLEPVEKPNREEAGPTVNRPAPRSDDPFLAPIPPIKPAKPLRTAMIGNKIDTTPRSGGGSGAGKTVCNDPRLIGRPKATVVGHYPGCVIPEPVEVRSIAGIKLSMPATLSCQTARTFANWITGVVDPAARKMLGARIKRVWVMGSFACRTRNSQRGTRLSEHSVGRAVDVGGFTLGDGRKLRVKADWGPGKRGNFWRHVWKRSCGMFKTVLGPEADRFHQDHLHLDVAWRKKTYCR